MTKDCDLHKQRNNSDKLTKAVALGYSKVSTGVPVVLATGAGPVAERILEVAREHGIYIKEDELLAESLSRLNLGQAIPPELYKAVAQVLAFVYALDSNESNEISD